MRIISPSDPNPSFTKLLALSCLGNIILNVWWVYSFYTSGYFTSGGMVDMIRAYVSILAIIACAASLGFLLLAGFHWWRLEYIKEERRRLGI